MVLLAIGALLGSLGPYGTYSCFAVPDRFGYWMLRSLLVGVICLGVLHAIMATKSCSSWSPTKKALAGVIVATMPCALIGFALASIFRHTPSTPLEIANLYGRVAIITMVVGIPLHLTRTMFAHGYEFLPAEVRPTRLAQSTEPTFLRREALGEIVRVPEIEIADLGTFDADDPKELSTQHPESPGVAWRPRLQRS